jgi:Zn-dependent metalloprotease
MAPRFSTYLFALLVTLPAAAEDALPPGRWQPLEAPLTAGRLGSGWSVWTDSVSGTPTMIAGPGLDLGGPLAADEIGIARTRALMEEFRELLGIQDLSEFRLERAVEVRNAVGQTMVYINFKQTWNGLDVWHQSAGGTREKLAMVRFRINGTLGRLALLGSDAVPLPPSGGPEALSEAQALERALQSAEVGASLAGTASVGSYVSVRGDRTFLARDARVGTKGPAHDWRFIYDAGTGERIETRDELRHVNVTGNVKAGSLDYPGGTFSQKNARALRATVLNTGNWDYTDSLGNFTIVNSGTSPVTLNGRLSGNFAVVEDQSGTGNLGFNRQVTPGTPENVVLNVLNTSEYSTAEASAYHWTTATHYQIAAYLPSFASGLALLPVNVNLDQTCNAYWSNSEHTINFYRAGDGCNNTAYSDVVAHEYGHGFHWWFHGSTSPGGFSEGIGDQMAWLMTNQRQVGRNFRTNGNPVRDYRPGRPANMMPQWPCDNCEVHNRGQIWAGFIMDLTENLIASQGAGGLTLARQITIPIFAANPSDEAEAVTEVYVLDDDDSTLANGTPHCADLTAAVRRHSLPIPSSLLTTCGADQKATIPEFRTPVLEAGLSDSGLDTSPALDGSQLRAWYVSGRAGGEGLLDIWTATRSSISSAWGVPTQSGLQNVNTTGIELSVTVSDDALTMYFASDRPGGLGGYDLWRSTRTSVLNSWGVPVNVTALNSSADEIDPTLSRDEQEIFFSTNRAPSSEYAIFGALADGTSWNAPTVHIDFASRSEYSPSLSRDGTILYYANQDVFTGDNDIRMSRRTGRGFRFSGTWRTINEVNTDDSESKIDLTSDDYSLYFVRSVFLTSNIWRADRIGPKLYGPSSGAANSTVTFTLRRDRANYGFIVLGVDPINPPLAVGGVTGLLGIYPLVTVAQGYHDANGRLNWVTPIANAPGAVIYLQGITQDGAGQFHLSERLAFLHLP